MKNIKINDIKVRAFEKKDLIEKLDFTENEAKLVMKYQKTFPELLQEIEGFVIDARILWEQLDKPQGKFNDWARRKLKITGFIENADYIGFTQACVKPQGGRPNEEYKLTLETAKHLAMSTGLDNNSSLKVREKGRLVRGYFIFMEKALRKIDEWLLIREPEKEGYKQLSAILDNQYKHEHTPNYIYSNEANMINKGLLGLSAKEIQRLLETKDKNTREHFNGIINKALYELQIMDSSLVMAGLDYDKRKQVMINICKTKYTNIQLMVTELRKVA